MLAATCSLALALCAGAAPAAAPGGAFPYPIHRTTLENGLQVVLVPTDASGLAAWFTVVRVGSRDEVDPGRSGFAHLFEHLTYRGTPTRSGEAWERAIKSLGLDGNAFTDDDVTAYWLFGPSAALPAVADLESDRLLELAYSEDDYEVEARTVAAEVARNLASPDMRVQQALRELAFERHPYRHTSFGTEKDVRAMSGAYRYSVELYRRLYRPEDTLIVVVGQLDEPALLARIRARFGAWKASGPRRPAVAPEARRGGPREVRLGWPAPVLPRVASAWTTPAAADLDATAAQLVLWPYLFGRASPLHRDLVLDRQLVQEIGGEFQPHRDPFLFGYDLVLRDAAAEAPARAAVDAAVADVAAGRVDAQLLADVKSNVRATLLMQSDTPYRTGVWLVYYTAPTGDPGYLDAVMARVAALGAEDLAAFVRSYLVPAGRSTVVLGRSSQASALPGARGAVAGAAR